MGNCTAVKEKKHKEKQGSAEVTFSTKESRPQSKSAPNTARPSFVRKESIRKKPNKRTISTMDDEAKDAEILEVHKKSRDIDLIKKYLRSHFLFKSIPEDVITQLTEDMKLYKMPAGSLIFEQGKLGKLFFLIKKGKVEISVDGTIREQLEHGRGFGEVALLQEMKRNSSAKCADSVEMWGLTRDAYKTAVRSQNTKNYAEHKAFIRSIPMFRLLTEKEVDSLIFVLTVHTFNQYEVIMAEGDPGDLMYIIKSGMVGCYIQKEEVRQMTTGEFFGEQALLYDTKRTATVIALDTVNVLSLGREDLMNVLGGHLENIIYKNSQRIAFEKSEILKNLLKNQIELIIGQMEIRKYNPGDVVIEKRTSKGENLLVVLNGTLTGDKKYKVFSCIGDDNIAKPTSDVFKETITAKDEAVVGVVPVLKLLDCIGGEINSVISRNGLIQILSKVPLLKHLPTSKIQSLLPLFKTKTFRKDEVVFKQKEPGNTFYIVNAGKVKVMIDGKELRSIGPNDFFGERAILMNEPRTATVISSSESTTCWVLNRDDFLRMLDDVVKQNLVKRMQLQNDAIKLTDLSLLCLVGKGQFGSVFLCKDKKGVEYALKTVSRGTISHYDLAENLILERRILLQLDHPMIVKLVKTFKDSHRVCFLMEYVKGQDLFDVLRSINILKEADSLFYSSCLALILEYLHSLQVIYRDLKPENVMIDYDGYPKLVDFGISRIVQGRTYTVIGTPHYMAPEVITGKGYNMQVDFWSLGIIIYEFIYCNVPFAAREDDPYLIYEKILERNLIFPERGSLPTANNLIQQLLSYNPSLRGTAESIKEHKWFKGVPWDNLLSKIFKPPYIPSPKPQKKNEINTKDILNYLIRYESQNNFRQESMTEEMWNFDF